MTDAPRTAAPPGDHLADRLSVGVLVSLFPLSLLDEAILISGCGDRRRRALPARLVIYYVLALCLFTDRNYDQVMRTLLDGLSWRSRGRRSWDGAPGASAISRARLRLGAEPLRVLFVRTAGPVPGSRAPAARYRGLRLRCLDGTTLNVPASAANSAFGGPLGAAATPRVRLSAVAEGRTHALIDATFGGSAVAQAALDARLLRCLRPGTLLVAPAGAWPAELLRQAAHTRAHLLLGLRAAPGSPSGARLRDGSYPSLVAGVPLRIVLTAHGVLATTLTDPARAPAGELAALYAERWTFEAALTWLRAGRPYGGATLRSRNPEMVAQEIWALLCVYHAMRRLTCQSDESPWPPYRRIDIPPGGPAGKSPPKR